MSAPSSRLDDLQRRVLATLAGFEPPWTLVGGAALVGFHLGHRTTRDLDLWWRDRSELRELPRELENRIRAAGLEARIVQSGTSFARIHVSDGTAVTVVDMVADAASTTEAPRSFAIAHGTILVSGLHDLFVD